MRRSPGGVPALLCGMTALTLLGGCTTGGPNPAATPSPAPSATSSATSSATNSPTNSPTGSPSRPDPAAEAAACAAELAAGLDLPGQAGQLLMVGVPVADLVQDPASGVRLVRENALGGVFLAGQSNARVATIAAAVEPLQAAAQEVTGVGLLVSADQEGGKVQRLGGKGFGEIPSALEQGRQDADALAATTRAWAAALREAGVNLNLAPVADVVPAGTAAKNPPIGAIDRQFGAEPDQVGADVATVVATARQSGVLSTLKHFPGLGRVRSNTDTSTRAVDEETTPTDPALTPFVAGMAAGAGAVMMSSARYPQLDAANLAAFSKPVVTGLLRERLGWTGVVISDDLGAAVAVGRIPVRTRAVSFVAAGGDIVLTIRPQDAEPMRAALVEAAQESASFRARVAQSAQRVVALKVAAGQARCG